MLPKSHTSKKWSNVKAEKKISGMCNNHESNNCNLIKMVQEKKCTENSCKERKVENKKFM